MNFEIGGIRVLLKSDIGIKKSTFAEKLRPFMVNSEKEFDAVIIHENNPEKFSKINMRSRPIYKKRPWKIYKENGYFYYCVYFKDKDLLIGKFTKDYKEGIIYKNEKCKENFLKNDCQTLTQFPTDQIIFSQILFQKQIVGNSSGIILHASGIHVKDEVILFCGPSGAGKSTIIKLLLKNAGGNFTILNDDRIIIRKKSDFFQAYGTPWHGELPYVNNLFGRLKKIYILNKAKENREERLSKKTAFPILFQRTIKGFISAKFQQNRSRLIEDIVNTIPIFRLNFSKDKPSELMKMIL